MKPARFDYVDPRSVDETMSELAQHGMDGKILAGGQSFVPLLNFRLARPAYIIDINRVSELDSIDVADDGLTIGAITRQQRVLDNQAVRDRWPLLTEAIGYIGHQTIRNRGTIGGILAHADPSAELPAVAIALNADITVRGQSGERVVSASDFFVDMLTTVVEPDELLTQIRFPALPPRTGASYMEFSRRHGDFAMAGAAAVVTLDENGNCAGAQLTLNGVHGVPYRAEIGSLLQGREVTSDAIAEAVENALSGIDPMADVHATSDYRRSLAATLSRRALGKAAERASGRVN